MNEFTTMYHYFKEFSETSPEKSVIELKGETSLPPTEECTNDVKSTHYLEMKSSNGSDNNNNDIMTDNENAIANISYLNVDTELSDSTSFDTVDGPSLSIEMQLMKKRDSRDLLNNLNDMRIKEEDEKEITNELKITEDDYYASNALNKTAPADDFSNECSDVLENVSQTETSSLSPSTNSIPSSSSDNQQNLQHGDYLIQPSNRPVTNSFGDYLTQPSNRPIMEPETRHDYMNTTNTPVVRSNLHAKREASHLRLYFKKKSESISEDGAGYSKIHELSSPTKSVRSIGTLKRTDSDASKKSVDDELLEIINDFKNHVFTIQEVEELVSSWKNRNDVKKSYKDKQDQLQKMREEYERIQHKMKNNLKRPSPFERMKRIFSRKHEKEVPLVDPVNLTGDQKFSSGSNRPTSTLSLASSNSSGRMSSSSLGDSGTHSDHEDRRNHHTFRVGHPGSLITDNYLIPPLPRPISTPSSTPLDEKESLLSFPSASENGTSSADSEHYIMYPSNVPLFPSPPSLTTFKGKF